MINHFTVMHGSSRARDLTRSEKKSSECATWPGARLDPFITKSEKWPPKPLLNRRLSIKMKCFECFSFTFVFAFPILCSFLRFLLLCCCFISIIPEKSSSQKSARLDPFILSFENRGGARLDPLRDLTRALLYSKLRFRICIFVSDPW